MPADEAFRARLREVVARSGRSMRAFSAAMGRDPGYIAALLDPTRPPRARPTPTDLLAASDATGIPFVELLEQLWEIPIDRLALELGSRSGQSSQLTPADRASLAEYAAFLAGRHAAGAPAARRARRAPTRGAGQ